MPEYKAVVGPQLANSRLDLFLIEFFKSQKLDSSRTFIQTLIRSGACSINELAILKPNYKVKKNDEIVLVFKERPQIQAQPQDIPIKVVYEDADIAVIDKPSGLVTHPAPGNYEHTLVNALTYRFKDLSNINPLRAGIVHRLDKDTSGLIVIAKNNSSHIELTRQFSLHSIKRKYAAVVLGNVEFDENIIEIPIGRHPYKRKNMAVGFLKNSKYAKTFYRTLRRSSDFSLLELEPFTGRTHQLRVHLAFIGHPIAGDPKYGRRDGIKRLMLHAFYLGFMHPKTAKFVEFQSEIPEEFRKIF